MKNPLRIHSDWFDYMDKTWHHTHHWPLGWLFCDLLDYHYGDSAKNSFRTRRRTTGLPAALFSLPFLGLTKVTGNRVKWGPWVEVTGPPDSSL